MIYCALVTGLSIVAAPVGADTYLPTVTWDNSNVDGNWDLDSGWSTGVEPTNADKVAIDNGRIVTITQTGEVADELRLASTPTARGTLRILSGDLTFRLGEVGDEGIGVVNQLGGSVTSTNRLWIGSRGPGYDAVGQGTYNLSGGTLTVLGTSNTAMRIGRAGATGVLNHSGGVLNTADQLNIAAIPAADGLPSKGSYIISGNAVLNVGSTLLNDATGADPGEALFEIRGSQVTMNMLSYGHRPDATLRYVADANGVSPMHILNAPVGVEIEDGLIDFDLTALIGRPPVLQLIDNQTANPIKGQGGVGLGRFTNAPEGAIFGDYMLTYYYDSGDGVNNDLALILIALDGDLDSDGFVGITDLNIVLGNWNLNVTPGDQLMGDPSGDGFVGIEDLNTVLGNWNAGSPPAAGSPVPEPAAWVILCAGTLAASRRRT
jgi:hypothetical protein